jgi:hypothetical protein
MTQEVKPDALQELGNGLTDKTTMANVIAGAAVVGGIIYALIKGDIVLIENLAFAGVGYLFGATAVKANGK